MPGGRPPSYDRKKHPMMAERLATAGFTDLEIAQAIGISLETMWRWKRAPEFASALKIGRTPADERVIRSLYQRAVGYNFPSVKIHVGAEGLVTEVPYIEHVPPDVTACIFWLKNRLPEQWRDAHNIDAAVGHYLISDKPMTPEDWIKARADVIEHEPAQLEQTKSKQT